MITYIDNRVLAQYRENYKAMVKEIEERIKLLKSHDYSYAELHELECKLWKVKNGFFR